MKKKIKLVVAGIGIFILTTVASSIIDYMVNRASDYVVPPQHIEIEKQSSDSVYIFHRHDFGDSDSLEHQLEVNLQNLKLINEYESEITKRYQRIQESGSEALVPRLLLKNRCELKGYTMSGASAYFTSRFEISQDSTYIDFILDFVNPEVIEDIACFRIYVLRTSGQDHRILQADYLYQAGEGNPVLLRLSNDFMNDIYQFRVGFLLQSDLNEEYPTFYSKTYTIGKPKTIP